MREFLKEVLAEKSPRFWYTVMTCYVFLLQVSLISIVITINAVLIKIDMSNDYILVIARGLDYAGLLSIGLWIYIAAGWIIDYGLPWTRRRIKIRPYLR
jgi:hypothetical protein